MQYQSEAESVCGLFGGNGRIVLWHVENGRPRLVLLRLSPAGLRTGMLRVLARFPPHMHRRRCRSGKRGCIRLRCLQGVSKSPFP